MPYDLSEEGQVGQRFGPDRPFCQHGNIIVVPGVSLGERLFRRAMVFRMKDCRLLPEGPLGQKRHDATSPSATNPEIPRQRMSGY